MTPGRSALVLAAALNLTCSKGEELLGEYSGSAFLTVDATPVAGTSGTRGPTTVCLGTIQIDSHDDIVVRGRFSRLECGGSAAVQGEASGTVQPDGTASLFFGQSVLPTSAAIRTSCGCPDSQGASGPYVGRITRSSVSVKSQFRLGCCGRPPRPPAFDVEYRIEAARR